MRRALVLGSLTIIAFASGFAARARADDEGPPTWLPKGDAAVSLTGPISLFPDHLEAGEVELPWREAALVAQFKPGQGPYPAHVFQLTPSRKPELLEGKTLCGGKTVRWIVEVPAPPGGLEIDAYSGADKPSSLGSPGLCGTFLYSRW